MYKLTGEAILTFAHSDRNSKFIQDATGGILIDDYDGIITSSYSIGDGITGVTGTIGSYAGLTQLEPIADPGTPTTTGNAVTPLVVTVSDLKASFDSYESELITISSSVSRCSEASHKLVVMVFFSSDFLLSYS